MNCAEKLLEPKFFFNLYTKSSVCVDSLYVRAYERLPIFLSACLYIYLYVCLSQGRGTYPKPDILPACRLPGHILTLILLFFFISFKNN